MAQTTNQSAAGAGYDPAAEDAYWRANHAGRAYVLPGMDYDEDYLPAYRYGLAASDQYEGRPFAEVTGEAEKGWDQARGKSRLSWEQAAPAVRDAFDRVIQLREERLRVDKERVKAGEVHVKKEVRTEHQTLTVPVEREEVVVERRAVNRPAAAGDFKEEEIRVPVTEEKVRASKEAVITEEVAVGKRKVTDTETVAADLKKEELKVEGEGKAKVRKTDGDAGKK